MPEKGGLIVVGFGGVAIDRHKRPGNVWPGYVPGEKADFTPQDHLDYAAMKAREYSEQEGGNLLNTLGYLGTRPGDLYEEARLCALVGDKTDAVSNRLRKHIQRMGLVDSLVSVPSYEPSVSVIERGIDEEGHVMDRMVRGRPRGGPNAPKGNHFTPEVVQKASVRADVVIFASLKSQEANRTVLKNTPVSALVSGNLGSSEVASADKAEEARNTLAQRRLSLLAINDEEIQRLYNEPDTSPRVLAQRANKDFADNVMVTCGPEGVLLAHNGDSLSGSFSDAAVEFAEGAKIDPRKIVSSLGAGDRAHGIALDEILRGTPKELIPGLIAKGTLDALRVAGAHQDLYTRKVRLMKLGRRLCANFPLDRG